MTIGRLTRASFCLVVLWVGVDIWHHNCLKENVQVLTWVFMVMYHVPRFKINMTAIPLTLVG